MPEQSAVVNRSTPTPSGQRASVGRAVHYVSRGSADGVYAAEVRHAVITGIPALGPDGQPAADGTVHLQVVNPNGTFHDFDVPHAESYTPGAWSWPARV